MIDELGDDHVRNRLASKPDVLQTFPPRYITIKGKKVLKFPGRTFVWSIYRHLHREDCDEFVAAARLLNKSRVNNRENEKVTVSKDLWEKAQEYDVNLWEQGTMQSTLINRHKKFDAKLKRKMNDSNQDYNPDDDEVFLHSDSSSSHTVSVEDPEFLKTKDELNSVKETL